MLRATLRIQVKRVIRDPPSEAYEQGVREGDLITHIDGKPIESLTHSQAISLIGATTGEITLSIVRRASRRHRKRDSKGHAATRVANPDGAGPAADEHISVTIAKGDAGLGIVCTSEPHPAGGHMIVVNKISPKGVVARYVLLLPLRRFHLVPPLLSSCVLTPTLHCHPHRYPEIRAGDEIVAIDGHSLKGVDPGKSFLCLGGHATNAHTYTHTHTHKNKNTNNNSLTLHSISLDIRTAFLLPRHAASSDVHQSTDPDAGIAEEGRCQRM
jgi:hypothetical protein